MKPLLLPIALLLSAGALANDPCDDVMSRAALQPEAGQALELLGGCLAARAEPRVHEGVALEMARISLHAGELDDAARYLDLLREMFDATARASHVPAAGQNPAGDR